MATDIEVRQATVSDRENIGTFFEKVFPNTYRYPERWEWLNILNPFIPNKFGVPEWIALLNNSIVGHAGAMYVQVKCSDRTINAAWGTDGVVSSACRGSGVGAKVYAADIFSHPMYIALEMTDVTRAMQKKIGCIDGPAVSLRYRTNHILPFPVLQEIGNAVSSRIGTNESFAGSAIKRIGIMKAYSSILKMIIRNRQGRLKALKASPSCALEPVYRFDDQADRLWTAVRSHYTFAVERTSAYLNWKYFDQPHMIHQCFYLRDHGAIKGILVIRKGTPPEHSVGVICECFLSESDVELYSWLIQKAISRLSEQGAAGIWVATANRELEDILRSQGFLKVRQARLMMRCKDNISNNEDIFSRPLLGKGDHDWDQFPRLRQPSFRQFIKLAFKRSC